MPTTPTVQAALDLRPQAEAVREKTVIRKTKEAALELGASVVFTYWRDRMGKHPVRTKLDAKRERKIIDALRESGGDPTDLLYAIDGALNDEWLMGKAANSRKPYNDIPTILRDRSQIERLCDLAKNRQDRHPYLTDSPEEA